MSDLTQVELLWLKKRIENWIRFGTSPKRRSSIVTAASSHSAPAASSPSSAGHHTATAPSSRASIFLRAVAPGERYSTVPYVRPAEKSMLRLSGCRRSRKSSKRSMPSSAPHRSR